MPHDVRDEVCPRCKGTKTQADNLRDDGTFQISCEEPALVTCKLCNGTGKVALPGIPASSIPIYKGDPTN